MELIFLLLLLIGGGIGLFIYFHQNPEVYLKVKTLVKRISGSIAFRATLVAGLTLGLLIPLSIIEDVVRDRGYLYQKVTREISEQWGGEQTLRGPVLSIPYTYIVMKEEKVKQKDETYKYIKRAVEYRSTYYQLPEQLDISGELVPEKRKRGIYEAVVYASDLNIQAQFAKPDFDALNVTPSKIHWNRAKLHFGLSETKGISDEVKLTVNKETIGLSAGMSAVSFLGNGFSGDITDRSMEKFDLAMTLPIRGSQAIYFAPFGKKNTTNIKSSWASPSFTGSTLPKDRNISADGFDATWVTSHLARPYPQSWVGVTPDSADTMRNFRSGIRLVQPVWLYLQTERSVKYALLLIGLTFLSVLIMERGFNLRFHPVQYGVVAAALTIVYLLILSLSEHIGFAMAYLIAATTVVFMTSAYSYASLRSKQLSLGIAGVLATLFSVLYIILNMEDFALLSGTILLMVVVGILMVTTRNLGKTEPQT